MPDSFAGSERFCVCNIITRYDVSRSQFTLIVEPTDGSSLPEVRNRRRLSELMQDLEILHLTQASLSQIIAQFAVGRECVLKQIHIHRHAFQTFCDTQEQ